MHVLDNHRQDSIRSVIGLVESARLEGEQGVAVVRLDDDAEIVRKVRDGVLTHLSAGYEVSKWRQSTDAAGMRIQTAIAWFPREISFVNVPADPAAIVRSATMPEEVVIEGDAPPAENRAVRAKSIRSLARSVGLPAEWADSQIDANADDTAVRAAAFDELTRRSPTGIRVHQVGPSNDDPAVILERRIEGLAARVMGTAPSDAARPFVDHRLSDHAAAFLAMRGESVRGMHTEAILTRAAQHGLSDFSNLLTGVGNRTLMPAYQAAQSPVKELARQTTLPDFRAGSKLRLSEVGQLDKVSESGEIKSTTRGESVESYALDTYATQFAISRKAMVNDDLGAFRDWGVAAGRAAAETEANLLVSLLTQSSGAGPIMGDGVRLFHADHGNLAASGDSPIGTGDLAPLSAGRKAMRDQKGLDGETPINATAKFLLVGSDLETEGERVLAAIYAATAATANPFSGRLTLAVEPRLPATAWYLFADPAVLPVLEYAYLSSAQGPQMASREGWDVLGMEFRVVLDFGAGAIDWRGAYRNAGA
jgi:hypothetical protein